MTLDHAPDTRVAQNRPAGDAHGLPPSDSADLQEIAELPPRALSALLDRWLSEELISVEQAEVLREDLAVLAAQERARSRMASIIVEALGYLGGAIIVVALGLVVGRFWPSIPPWARIGAGLALAVALFWAGLLAPAAQNRAADRLRSVLWLVTCVVLGGTGAMIAVEVFDLRDESVALVAFLTAGVMASVVWRLHPGGLQQATVFVALVGTAAFATAVAFPAPQTPYDSPEPPAAQAYPGVAVWVVGAVWLGLAWARKVKPAELAKVIGAVAMVFGSFTCMQFTWGIYLAVATVALVVVLSVWLRDFGLLIVGAVGTLQVLPQAITTLFPGALAAAGALLVVGAALIAAAIFIARRRNTDAEVPQPEHRGSVTRS